MPKVDHSQDHKEHASTFNSESGQYEHPSSLSDHIGDAVDQAKATASDYMRRAGRVVKNLTGEGEREDLFNK